MSHSWISDWDKIAKIVETHHLHYDHWQLRLHSSVSSSSSSETSSSEVVRSVAFLKKVQILHFKPSLLTVYFVLEPLYHFPHQRRKLLERPILQEVGRNHHINCILRQNWASTSRKRKKNPSLHKPSCFS